MASLTASSATPLGESALADLEALRPLCTGPAGGLQTLQAVRLFLLSCPMTPTWLRDEFLRRHARVADAHVPTWDHADAFGPPWPKGIKSKRLAAIRQRVELRRRVHRAVWNIVSANPSRGVGKVLFDEVSELPDIPISRSTVETLYYEAVAAGMLNVAMWRAARIKSD